MRALLCRLLLGALHASSPEEGGREIRNPNAGISIRFCATPVCLHADAGVVRCGSGWSEAT